MPEAERMPVEDSPQVVEQQVVVLVQVVEQQVVVLVLVAG
jgi:hypothetical protein